MAFIDTLNGKEKTWYVCFSAEVSLVPRLVFRMGLGTRLCRSEPYMHSKNGSKGE